MTTVDLAACLRREIELAAGIVSTLDEQQKALLGLDLAGLEASVPALDELTEELRRAEGRRQAAAGVIAAGYGFDAGAPLQELLAALPAAERRELEQARRRLGALIEEICRLNHANYALMLNAARFNRVVLQFVAGTAATYARNGAPGEAGEARSLIFSQEA